MTAKMVHIVSIDINEINSFGRKGYDGLMNTNIWLHSLPDMSSSEKAIEILKENNVWEEMSPSIREYLTNVGPEKDVLKAEEFEKMDCRIFGVMPTHMNFLPVAMKRAEELGYTPHLITRKTNVEASAAGALMARIANTVENDGTPFQAPCALIMTGELLVTVGQETGIGGRNQEFAISTIPIIKGSKRVVVASGDTDGTDGPGGAFNEDATARGCTTLAGGIIDGYTMAEAQERGVDIGQALKTHATSEALWKLDSGIWATNNISVQDLIVVLIMDHDG